MKTTPICLLNENTVEHKGVSNEMFSSYIQKRRLMEITTKKDVWLEKAKGNQTTVCSKTNPIKYPLTMTNYSKTNPIKYNKQPPLR